MTEFADRLRTLGDNCKHAHYKVVSVALHGAAHEIDRLDGELASAAGYPCSPLCEGYLREQRVAAERDELDAVRAALQNIANDRLEEIHNARAMLDRYAAPTQDDSDGRILSLADRIEAMVYRDSLRAET